MKDEVEAAAAQYRMVWLQNGMKWMNIDRYGRKVYNIAKNGWYGME